jgi:hypothetical protein
MFVDRALACGSMVLYRYCVYFVRQGEIHKEFNMTGRRKF